MGRRVTSTTVTTTTCFMERLLCLTQHNPQTNDDPASIPQPEIYLIAGESPVMTRRCSHCSNNGHNSRTCPTRMGQSTVGGRSGRADSGVKLFGVRLTEGGFIMKKSASMGCLSHYSSLAAQVSPNPIDSNSSDMAGDNDRDAEGYASDDPNHESCSMNRRGDRKRGVPWTEEEHTMFLVGLQKLGKGDWRGIARNFVLSKTPTQVASHAQKYFIRQTNSSRRKRRSSLFDMVPDMYIDEVPLTEEQIAHSPLKSESSDNLSSLDRNLGRESVPDEPTAERMTSMEIQETTSFMPPFMPAFYPAFFPVPYSFWSPSTSMPVNEEELTGKTHEVLKPIPILAKDSTYTNELVGMSHLSLGDYRNSQLKPSSLSSKLLADTSSRQSAFHPNPPVVGSDVSQRNSSDAVHTAEGEPISPIC